MPTYHLLHLNRQAYINSTSKISDEKTLSFSKMSLDWWDRHFSWKAHGCVVLADVHGQHLCYIFYKIDRYHQYMTIHNIFTPLVERRKGYAKELLKMIFDTAVSERVRRFRLSSISNSLDFYLALGFIYWGLNSVGDYYCDLPMPANGLAGLQGMTDQLDMDRLVGSHLVSILNKVKDNDTNLSPEQSKRYEQDKVKMDGNYRFLALGLHHQKHSV